MSTLTLQKPISNSYKPVKNLLSEGSTNIKTAKNSLKTHEVQLANAKSNYEIIKGKAIVLYLFS